MKKLISLCLALSLIVSLFSVALSVNAASLYDAADLMSGSLFDSTTVITSDGANKNLSNDIWSFYTVAGQGAEQKNISDIAEITVDDGKTLLSKNDREGVKFYAINNNNGKYHSSLGYDGNAAAILKDFDGQIGAHSDFQGLDQLVVETSSGVYNSRRDYNYSADFIVDLGSVCDISGFMVSGSNNERFVPGMYRIYASKEIATLFNNKPLIDFTDSYADDSVAKANANAIFELNDGNKLLARYVAFRFADVCCQNAKDQPYEFIHNNFRGSELAVFGEPVATKEGISATVETSQTPLAPEGYDSLVVATEGNYVLPSKTDITQSKTDTKNPTGNLVDGIYAAGGYDDYSASENANGFGQQSKVLGYIVDDKFYTQVTHQVMDSVAVKKIQIVGHTNPNLKIGRYVLFAGDDKETLYSPENIILDYDNSTIVNEGGVCLLTGNSDNMVSRQQIIDFGEGFKAKYIGMRVYDTCGFIAKSSSAGHNAPGSDGGAVYLRLHEFNVFGQPEYTVENLSYNYDQYKANVDIAHSLIADKNPVYTRATNYLTGEVNANCGLNYVATPDATDTRTLTDSDAVAIGNLLWRGAYYALDLKNAQGQPYAEGEKKDGKTDTFVDNGVDMNQIVAFDMEKPKLIDKLSYISHTSAQLQLHKYQISFADSSEALFTDDAVYTTDVITSTTTAGTVTFKKEIVAQFVGLKVIAGVRPSAVGSYDQVSCYTRLSHLAVFGSTYGSVSTVTFADKEGNKLYEAATDADGYLSKTDITAANDLVPAIFGYKKATDENGQRWSVDVNEPILEDVTITPLYEKDTSLVYTLTHNKVGGETDTRQVQFDEKIVLTDPNANSFKIGSGVIGGAETTTFYAAGDMIVDSSTDAAPDTPSITVVSTLIDKKGGKASWRIFAQAYVPEGFTAVKVGALFISPYTEKQLSKEGISDWTFETLTEKHAFVKGESFKEGVPYAMINLNNVTVSNESPVIRKAKAYLTYTENGATKHVYSDVVTNNFGV